MTKYTMIFTHSNGDREVLVKKFETYKDAMAFESNYFASHADIVHVETRMAL